MSDHLPSNPGGYRLIVKKERAGEPKSLAHLPRLLAKVGVLHIPGIIAYIFACVWMTLGDKPVNDAGVKGLYRHFLVCNAGEQHFANLWVFNLLAELQTV